VSPSSKSSLAEWYASTSLKRLFPVPEKALAPQRFWDHMGYLTEERLRAIENDLTKRLIEHFKINPRALFFDATNFDTFISSSNPSELAKRGKAKSKRMDLRLISLALMVSVDSAIPLFSHVYPGNQADSVTFSELIGPLAERHKLFSKNAESVTLVFDKGNNSADNIAALAETPYHFIGSLVATQHQDLLDIPLDRFSALKHPRLTKVIAHRCRKEVYGKSYTIVITRSPGLLDGQIRGIHQHLSKRIRKIRSLQHKLRLSQLPNAKGKGYTLESLQKQCKDLASGQYLQQFLKVCAAKENGKLVVRYRIDQKAFDTLKLRQLGKTIIFTDNHTWSSDDIVRGYRGQFRVENAFRGMKDPHWICFSPQFHWTDPKIRVHAFSCVFAYTMIALLQRKLASHKINLSFERMLGALSKIKEMLVLYPNSNSNKRGKGPRCPRVERVLSKLNKIQKRLYNVLKLERLFN
jgi:transposase